jgi:5-methylcytosine-specific restriction endonuclease McrA
MTRKQDLRRSFREDVFARDGYRCVVCGFQSTPALADGELDAHHVTPREQMPHGGYVVEIGVSLCSSDGRRGTGRNCHYIAELVLSLGEARQHRWYPDEPFYPYSPKALYERVRSSYEKAYEASTYLR